VKSNEQGIGNKHLKWHQFREAFTNPHTYALFLYGVLSDIPNGGLSTFFGQLIVSSGYAPTQSLLCGILGGVVVIFACLSNGWAGGNFQNRALIASIPMASTMIGLLLIVALPTTGHGLSIARLIGYYMTQTNPATCATILSLISSNVAGSTKKTTVAALYLIGYCAGKIIGPQQFRPKDAPQYVPAEITVMICYALCVVDLVSISWWYRRENRKKAAIRDSVGYVITENHG
jgi:ACS family allantoate permease-like MFS transporter